MVEQDPQEPHDRVAEAIREAEAHTSGEIFCVLTGEVSRYLDVALAISVTLALLLPLALIPLGFDARWLPGMASSWQAAHLAAMTLSAGQAVLGYVMIQALVLVTSFFLIAFTPMRRWVVPGPIRRERVRQAALMQFLAHGLQQTRARTGVLIFAAATDRRVEIIADEGIHSKVPPEVWGKIAGEMASDMGKSDVTGAFETAIAECGRVLAEHFPPAPNNPNELSDRLVVF